MDRNLFVEQVLPNAVLRALREQELDTYRAPFSERASRRPTLVWPREIPVDGAPADVATRTVAAGPGMPAIKALSTIGSPLSTLVDAHRRAATIAWLSYPRHPYMAAPSI